MDGVDGAKPGWLRVGLLAAPVLAVLILGAAWAIASHPGSGPDDDFHLPSAWCAWGLEATGCELGEMLSGRQQVEVPALEAVTSRCLIQQPAESAACIAADPPDAPTFAWSTNAGSYPPGYYAAARAFVGGDTERSIIVLRIASFLVCAGLLVAGGLLLAPRERWGVWWTWLVVSVPLGLFFFASNNPSGPTIAGAAAVGAAAYSIGQRQGRAHTWAAVAVGLAGVLIAGQSRSDGWQFAAVALVLGALASVQDVREAFQPRSLLPWLAIFSALVVTWLASGSTAALGYGADIGSGAGAGGVGDDVGVSRFQLFLDMPELYIGEFATRLGWLDTSMPAIVWGLTALALGGVIVLGVQTMTPFRGLALSAGAAALFAIPFLILVSKGEPVGSFVQPRYMLPLVLTLGLLLAVRPGRGKPFPVWQAVLIASLATVAHTWALHRTIRRSVTGVDADTLDLSGGAEWWWNIAVGPNGVWIIGSLAFATLIAWLTWRMLRERVEIGRQEQFAVS